MVRRALVPLVSVAALLGVAALGVGVLGVGVLGVDVLGVDVLRVARGPHRNAAPPEPRGVRFASGPVDLGCVGPDAAPEARLAWRRVGPGSLRVLAVRTDCGCAVLSPLPPVLEPGARGGLRVRLEARRRSGPFRVRVRVVTDGDEPADVAEAHVVGYVRHPFRLRPDVLALGRRSTDSVVERRVEVTWPRGDDGLQPAVRLAGLSGRVEAAVPAIRGRAGCDLVVRIDVPAEPGRFAGVLEVDLGTLGAAVVPIRGEAVGAR